MSNDELNLKLYQKMQQEQEKYGDWLKGQSPDVILRHAFEYAMREDIVYAMEYHDLPAAHAEALLASDTPVADIYSVFEQAESPHMDSIRSCIESCAESHIRDQAEKLRNLPVYNHSATYAREHGELDAYRASHRANITCRDAIEDAIRDNYRDNRLDDKGAKSILDRFGSERTLLILANTIQDKDWDGRISQETKLWAKGVHVPDDPNVWGGNRRHEYRITQAHPGLIDLFTKQVRREVDRLRGEKNSIRSQLGKAQTETKRSPQKKSREAER